MEDALGACPVRARPLGEAFIHLADEVLGGGGDLAQPHLAHLGDVGGHHRQARGQVLAHLQRVGVEGQLVDGEGHQRHIEGAAVARQARVRLAPQEVDVGHRLHRGHVAVRRHLADDDDRALGVGLGRGDHRLLVHPVGHQPEEADDGLGQVRDVLRNGRGGIARLDEVLEVHAVAHQHGVRVDLGLVLPQALGGGDDEVGAAQQPLLQLRDVAPVGVAERGELIHAVVDDELLAERARHGRGGRQEGPRDGPVEAQLAHRVFHLEPQELPVGAAHHLRAVEGNRQGRQHEEVGLHLPDALGEGGELLPDALEIVRVGLGRAVADAVDPEHPVVPGEDPHDVDLGQRVSVPIVREDDQVPSPEGPASQVDVFSAPHVSSPVLKLSKWPPWAVHSRAARTPAPRTARATPAPRRENSPARGPRRSPGESAGRAPGPAPPGTDRSPPAGCTHRWPHRAPPASTPRARRWSPHRASWVG
ncbi:hypothetical protein STIAU_5105 [Stigmatella aurantiaca DW4/3-1]|uniref:Uncharacterized protein n=1 Tax=Stigmatella aurantiaca (strain DW4/3-1) TaxID=378806 RepID=Q097Z8_STIAD|nr:hypothetical protein STIAU_5105 [Stigmatella aurantiaca DW4/3-1]